MFRKKDEGPRCSCCGKSQDEAKKLVGGPAAYICDACVDVGNSFTADGDAAPRHVDRVTLYR